LPFNQYGSYEAIRRRGYSAKIMKEIDPEVINRVFSIDWISISLHYSKGGITSQEFRLKRRGERAEIATRYGDFLPEWQGYIRMKKNPTLYLKKLDGKEVNLEVPIPPSDSPRDTLIMQKIPLGEIMIRFTKFLAG